MDLPFRQRQIREVYLKKAAQMAGSEAIRNVIGCLAHQDPDPVLLVLPDENTTKKIMRRRILPLFEDTPCLAALKTASSHDQGLATVLLGNGFELSTGWSGSPATLASDPIRAVFPDEVDKFAEWRGKEADPLSLAKVRTATYENSLVYAVSTPTVREGPIEQGYQAAAVKLWYFVPCPHCGEFQRLTFDRLEWGHKEVKDHKARASAIERDKAAWYRCIGCEGRITDQHKPKMLTRGYWGTADGGYKLFYDGREEGEFPAGTSAGLHIWAAYSLAAAHRFWCIAAEFCKCIGDPMKMQNFRNSWLAEIWEEVAIKPRASAVKEKAEMSPPPLLVPPWCSVLLASADTQKDHFYFTIRAWGYGLRSQLVHYGMVQTFDELYRVCLQSQFSVRAGVLASPLALLIDTGGGKVGDVNRTQEVYQFALKDQGRIVPCKGASHAMRRPWELSKQPNGVILRLIDTGYFKDTLARLMNSSMDEEGGKVELWMPHKGVSEDYCLQMASEHKVIDRKRGRMIWVPVTSGAANHYWDCETLQCAGADMANVATMKPPAPVDQPVRAERDNPIVGYRGKW